MSVHQPRYSIFKLCDRLTLLSLGEMVYHGPAQQSLEYFDRLGTNNCEKKKNGCIHCNVLCSGYPVEEHDNPADHFLDVINTCEQAMDEKRKKEMVQASNPAIVTHTGLQGEKVIDLAEFYRKSEEHWRIKSQLDPLVDNLPNKEGFLSPRKKVTYATSFLWQVH